MDLQVRDSLRLLLVSERVSLAGIVASARLDAVAIKAPRAENARIAPVWVKNASSSQFHPRALQLSSLSRQCLEAYLLEHLFTAHMGSHSRLRTKLIRLARHHPMALMDHLRNIMCTRGPTTSQQHTLLRSHIRLLAILGQKRPSRPEDGEGGHRKNMMKGTDCPLQGRAERKILDEDLLLSSQTIVVPVVSAIRNTVLALDKALEGLRSRSRRPAPDRHPQMLEGAHLALLPAPAVPQRRVLQHKARKTLSKPVALPS